MEESIEGSVAAPIIFLIVVAVQYLSRHVQLNTSRISVNAEELKLRAEIKQLQKEANAMSQPSTFAQAAKLRRTAAAKEQELAKYQEKLMKEMKSSYDTHTKALMVVKVLTYFLLIICFWRIPVASIPKQLLQPFGRILSWRSGGPANENVMVENCTLLIDCRSRLETQNVPLIRTQSDGSTHSISGQGGSHSMVNIVHESQQTYLPENIQIGE